MKRFISRLALVAVAALFVGVASAEEEVLYFMVNDPEFADGTKPTYDYVMVALSDGGTPPNPSGDDYLTLYGGDGMAPGQVLDAGSTAPVYVGLGDYSPTDVILFELWFESPEGSWERVAYHSANISDLRAHIGSSTNPSATPYVVRSVVPEPTGGLLALVGMAVLALRRKRI